MATKSTPLPISEKSQERVVKYANNMVDLYATSYNIRDQLIQRDLAYYREADQTPEQLKAKAANRAGDAKKIQNITVPVSYTHLTLPTTLHECRSRWSPYH